MTDKDIEMWEVVIHMYKTIGYGDLLRWSKGKDSPEWIRNRVYDHTGIEIGDDDLDEIYEYLIVLRAMVFMLKPLRHPNPYLITTYKQFFKELSK